MCRNSILLICTVAVIIFILFLNTADSQKKQKLPKNGINLRNIGKNKVKGGKNDGKGGKIHIKPKPKPKPKPSPKPKPGPHGQSSNFLKVQNKELVYNKQKIFLSGANLAYNNYAEDFGGGAYAASKATIEGWLSQIAANGGNAARVWLHVDGSHSPVFDSDGYATGSDTTSLIQELGEMLDAAEKSNIFVVIALWHLGYTLPPTVLSLFSDESKLAAYLEKVLRPLAAGLKSKKALAYWDIVNEPEGSIQQGIADANPCFDTTNVETFGDDWSSNNLTMFQVQRAVNRHVDAIKASDPKALVSLNSREQESSNYCDLCRDYWTDKCLIAAGGKSKGVTDLYSMESFTWEGQYYYWSPLLKTAADYKLTKPIVLGSLSTACSESNDTSKNFIYLYNNGYSGALDWEYNGNGYCTDSTDGCNQAISAIKDMTGHGLIKVAIK